MHSLKDSRRSAVLVAVRAGGGVVRRQRLVRDGHSPHVIAELVRDGTLSRIRRTWVAAADADLLAAQAAARGVLITCVTDARRRGLWVLSPSGLHVAAHVHSATPQLDPGSVVHWRRPLVPRHPDALFDALENTLVNVAMCQPFEAALAVWESALNKRLVDPLVLRGLPLPRRALRLLEQANPFADSGLETFVPMRLAWMRVRIVPQALIAGRRVDFLIGDRLVLQIDGGTHVGAQREQDVRHDAQLLLMGYRVVRVGYHQVVDDWPAVQDVIMRAVAQGFHRRDQARSGR
ncbi:DUF559 domain-containing protein [Microbacterium sp. 1P10UB]|uniref:endonuclease domain-containing protein n=1 Tax=unclassified Microbacterium TaxID=2609290 RepID=UPI0039A1F7B2